MDEEKDLLGSLILELRRGTLILSVLSQVKTPRYGYALVQSLEEKGVLIEANTLYPLLRRLEKQGLLKSQWDTGESKPRKYYTRTAEGDRIYHELRGQWREISVNMERLLEEALQKLGNPALFAGKYRNENRYVIGPEYYDNYIWVLEIVMIGVWASALLSLIVQTFITGSWASDVWEKAIEQVIMSSLGAFGSVTLIFAILERQHVNVELKKEKAWSVDDLEKNQPNEKAGWSPQRLKPVPDKRARISRSESVVSIVFTVILSGLFIFAPWLLGAYVFENHEFVKTIPLLDLENWNILLPFLLLSLMLGFIDDMIKLVKGCYCSAVMVGNIICSAGQIFMAVFLLKILPFWNPGFMEEVSRQFNLKVSSKGDVFSYYGTHSFSNIILGVIVLIICIEMGVTIYKSIRYGADM